MKYILPILLLFSTQLFAVKYKTQPIHDAIIKGDLAEVRKIVEADSTQLKALTKGYHKVSPMRMACKKNQLEIVKYLVSKGVSVNEKIGKKTPALYDAANVGSLQIIDFLLEQGADINSTTGNLPPGFKYPFGQSSLYIAVMNKDLKVTEHLLKKGAKVNLRFDAGEKTALDYAKSEEIKALLLKYGAKTAAELKKAEK